MAVLIQTSVGDISIDLYTEEAPLTCYNFLALCHLKFYNNCLFHSVEKGFVCRAGNPATAAPTWGLGLPQHLQQLQKESEQHIDDGGCSIWGLRHLHRTRQLDIHRKLRQHKLTQRALHHEHQVQQRLHPAQQQSYEPLMLGSVYADVMFSNLQFGSFPAEEAAAAVRLPADGSSVAVAVRSSRFCPLEAKNRGMQKGLVGMLPNAAGRAPGGASAFFVTLGAGDNSLAEKTTIFGEVSEGLEVLERINFAFVDEKHVPLTVRLGASPTLCMRGTPDFPAETRCVFFPPFEEGALCVQPIRILRVYVLHDPFFMRPRKGETSTGTLRAPTTAVKEEALSEQCAGEAAVEDSDPTKQRATAAPSGGKEEEGDVDTAEEELDVRLLGIEPPPSPPPLEEEVKSDEEVDELKQVEKLCQKEAEARKGEVEWDCP